MEEKNRRQYLKVGKTLVELPPGVTSAEWALERVRLHNPRIRCYLGCIRMIEKALDSNYAILHCSPARLAEIWELVRGVSALIRAELSPSLKEPSVFPDLDVVLRKADTYFEELSNTVLREVDRYPDQITADYSPHIRKLLCVATGKIYAFLRDTLGEILATDPRSRRDADYFLSKSFARDIEESEWLYSSVYMLREYVDGLQKLCSAEFKEFLLAIGTERMIPHPDAWKRMLKPIHMLLEGLTPKLKEVLTLRGIRLKEIEPMDKYTFELPYQCMALMEIYEVGRLILDRIKAMAGTTVQEREQSVRDLVSCHEIVSGRMIVLVSGIDNTLRNLTAFLPTWMAQIERRRCLMLTKSPTEIPLRSDTAGPEIERRKQEANMPEQGRPQMTTADERDGHSSSN
jgi:hypothetical protein